MAKYLADVSGVLTEIQPITVSGGAGDASKIIQTDSSGRIDMSFMPAGIAAEVSILPSSENLAAGDFVNIYNASGTATVRKADATTAGKPAQGFTLASVTSPANATIYTISTKNTAKTGLTPGTQYYLATTAGAIQTTAPTAAGSLVQPIGTSESATAIVFSNANFFWVKA